MMNISWLAGFLLSVMLVACSSTHPEIQPLSAQGVVLAFGDSLTAGTGASTQNSYPSVLASLINRKVINGGVPGEISDRGLKRLPALLDDVQPELVIIAHGGNDMIRKLDRAKLDQNIRNMIHHVRQRGVSVILIGVPRPGLFLSSDGFYKTIAEDYNIPIEDQILADVLSEPSLKSDPIHPNSRGYGLIAESIYELMRKTGAI